MISPLVGALPFRLDTRFAFRDLLRLPARGAGLINRSDGAGGTGVPSSVAAAASVVPNSAASFSARFEARCKLRRSGCALHT